MRTVSEMFSPMLRNTHHTSGTHSPASTAATIRSQIGTLNLGHARVWGKNTYNNSESKSGKARHIRRIKTSTPSSRRWITSPATRALLRKAAEIENTAIRTVAKISRK
jgi:hypothetical protein